MNKIILAAMLCLASAGATADQYVKGHVRSDGTYVQPHYRSSPNSSTYDNYSTQGNTNPYTGQNGNVNPYQQQQKQINQHATPAPSPRYR